MHDYRYSFYLPIVLSYSAKFKKLVMVLVWLYIILYLINNSASIFYYL